LQLIHMHGASIGEVKCLARLKQALCAHTDFAQSIFLLTFTSSYGRAWLESSAAVPFTESRQLNHNSIGDIRKLVLAAQGDCACIIAEKDRRPSILSLHERSKFVLNIEAKPPQTGRSAWYERLVARSLQTVKTFAVENETYAEGIRQYAPNATVTVTGTLKAPDTLERAPQDRPRVAFLSVLAHEGHHVAQIVACVRRHIPEMQAIVLPRYVGDAPEPWKRLSRTLRSVRKHLPDARIVLDAASLESTLLSRDASTVVFTGLGLTPKILAFSTAAVVCGSLSRGYLTPAKGHNFLEPLAAGLPTFVGPHHRNWAPSVADFVNEGTLQLASTEVIGMEVASVLADTKLYAARCSSLRSSKLLRFHQETPSRLVALIRTMISRT
jgi:3-deoxy-D-manno-octulosonic-acid transferase